MKGAGGPRVGDLFTVRGRRLVGRVVSTSAVVGPTHGCLVAYVYADATLSRDALLVPPLLTTRAPWSHGLFVALRHEPIRPGGVLEHHVFRDARGALFDEEGRPTTVGSGPVGEYRLLPVEALESALAATTASYDVPEPSRAAEADLGGAVRDLMTRWSAAVGRRPTRDEWLSLYDAALDASDEDEPS